VAAARAVNPGIQVLYHSDGALTGLLEDLIDAGVTAVNPCQPEAMDLLGVKRAFGDRLCLWGCTATQSTFTRGKPEDVEADLRRLMDQVATGGGLVVQFYNMLVTPRVEANLLRFVERFLEVGRYG
jgi:predicted amidohydrolase YtcJ